MTVIFAHDLDLAGFQDLEALRAELEQRFGKGLGGYLWPVPSEMASSGEIAARLDPAMPAEDRAMLEQLVMLQEA